MSKEHHYTFYTRASSAHHHHRIKLPVQSCQILQFFLCVNSYWMSHPFCFVYMGLVLLIFFLFKFLDIFFVLPFRFYRFSLTHFFCSSISMHLQSEKRHFSRMKPSIASTIHMHRTHFIYNVCIYIKERSSYILVYDSETSSRAVVKRLWNKSMTDK